MQAGRQAKLDGGVAVSTNRMLVAEAGDSEPGPALALHGAGRPAQRSGSSGRVLVLNASYEPINVCTVRRAAVLILKNRAEILEQGDWALHAESFTLARPVVIRLLTYVRIPRDAHRRKITRRAVFARDLWTCQYCGHQRGNLTVDHVIPRSKGGTSTWENIVTCCAPCNRRKGDRLPRKAKHGAGPAQKRVGHHLHSRGGADDPRRLGAVSGDCVVDDRPARAGELRGLRRWLLVAAVWATAATAIAVIALIAATDARDDNTKAGRQSARTTDQVIRVQRRLDGRLEQLERRVDALPGAGDLTELANRVERVEKADEGTADQVDELTTSVGDLEQRVESLEEAPAGLSRRDGTAP